MPILITKSEFPKINFFSDLSNVHYIVSHVMNVTLVGVLYNKNRIIKHILK